MACVVNVQLVDRPVCVCVCGWGREALVVGFWVWFVVTVSVT